MSKRDEARIFSISISVEPGTKEAYAVTILLSAETKYEVAAIAEGITTVLKANPVLVAALAQALGKERGLAFGLMEAIARAGARIDPALPYDVIEVDPD